MALPETLTLNAFTGDDVEVAGQLASDASRWGSKGKALGRQVPLAPAAELDLNDWTHPEVGWGVVLPDREDMSPRDKAEGLDAPVPIRELLATRADAPVLRYRPDLQTRKLARYFANGSRQDPEIGLTPFGTAKGQLPLYLLIVGSPADIPWELQFSLNRRHFAGRLDLPDDGLANYVAALQTDWKGARSEPAKPLVWAVDYDSMLKKMDATIASRIGSALAADDELRDNALPIRGEAATGEALVEALRRRQPSVVVTSSHGKTGPLDDPAAMQATLGLPVDTHRQPIDVDRVVEWTPAGAVWFAHACCSAGSQAGTSYAGLLEEGTLAWQVVEAIGELGASSAPLPARLLGSPKPLRAFVGHVEPTFDWTLIANDTGQFLTGPLVEAVHPNLYRRWPLGRALEEHYRGVGALYGKLQDARRGIDQLVAGTRELATYYRLTAIDRESLVILGDPTVVIPPLPSQGGSNVG